MTPDQYRAALSELGLSQIAAAKLLGVDARTSRHWAKGDRNVSPVVVRFLNYLRATGTSGEKAIHILASFGDL